MKNIFNNSKYHVLIPAAGKSTRLAHLTRNKPKAFIDIAGKSLIEYSLDLLHSFGFTKATFVLGYMKDYFIKNLGKKYKDIDLSYVYTDNWEATGHGYGLFLTKKELEKENRDVILMDADGFFDKILLEKLLLSPFENVVVVDSSPKSNNEEEIVLGKDGIVKRFVRGIHKKEVESVGEFVGINKFSSGFIRKTFDYMDEFFKNNGPMIKYERIFDDMILKKGEKINYIDSAGTFWINMNNEMEYNKLKKWILNNPIKL